ncbi:hypothetical protein EII17_07270 [Clostridiales bacterium COT073_COT-073]|nr:hypothetical protein EII17_07270 [Clostridiales bacterium COT073_COT-073]
MEQNNNHLPPNNHFQAQEAQDFQNTYQYNYNPPTTGTPPYYSYGPNQAYSGGNYPPQGYAYPTQPNMPEEISVWKYLGMMWVSVIPFIGIIVILIWAFSSDQINRRNYARAVLLNIVISLVLGFVMWGAMMALFMQMMDVIEKQQRYMY